MYIISPKTGSKEIVSTFSNSIRWESGWSWKEGGWGPVIILMKEMRQSWPVFLRMKVLIGFSGAGGSVLDIFFQKCFLPIVQLLYDVEGKT